MSEEQTQYQTPSAQRNYRKHLRDLTEAVSAVIDAVDIEMGRRAMDIAGRGPRIAKIMNALNLANDRARHFGLGIPLRNLHQKVTT